MMKQVDKLLIHLKRTLKSKAVTYKQVAQALDLSESSVKRLFSSGDISLERIEKICTSFDVSFIELCRYVGEESRESRWVFSKAQEKEMANDMRLGQIYFLLHAGKNPNEILEIYEIDEKELLGMLLILDRVQLIELHENNRVKIVNKGPFRFRRDGLIGRKIFLQTRQDFLNSDFEGEEQHLAFSVIPLIPHLAEKLKRQYEKALQEYLDELQYIEINEDNQSLGVLFSYRPWKIHDFSHLKTKKGHL